MSSTHDYNSLLASPTYQQLSAIRKRVVWPLAILVTAVYFTYVFLIAFDPSLMAATLPNSIISIGIVSGLGLILFTFVVTWAYVRYANKHIEPLLAELHNKAGK